MERKKERVVGLCPHPSIKLQGPILNPAALHGLGLSALDLIRCL